MATVRTTKQPAAPAPAAAPVRATRQPRAAAPAPAAQPTAPAAPPKERTSLSEEEVAAAVAGNLQPRQNKGDVNAENLLTTDEKGRPTGRPVGVTTGLPITGAWSYIFQENEKAPKNKKMTDEEISAWMKQEFPGRTTPAFDHPQGCRRDYNTGRFTKYQPPQTPSSRFDDKGDVMTARAGRGKQVAETPAPAPAPAAPVRAPRAVRQPVAAPAAPAAPARVARTPRQPVAAA